VGITIVFLGEIVGKTGVFTVKSTMPEIRQRFEPDFIFANANSATGCAGLGIQHAVYLRKLGIDCITMGEAAYYKPDMTEFYPKAGWVLRPANLPEGDPGRGWRVSRKMAKEWRLSCFLGSLDLQGSMQTIPFGNRSAQQFPAQGDRLYHRQFSRCDYR